jgi:hypothetical protein
MSEIVKQAAISTSRLRADAQLCEGGRLPSVEEGGMRRNQPGCGIVQAAKEHGICNCSNAKLYFLSQCISTSENFSEKAAEMLIETGLKGRRNFSHFMVLRSQILLS